MNHGTIKNLKHNPRDVALMLEDNEIEEVIVAFVEVKNLRDQYRAHRVAQ